MEKIEKKYQFIFPFFPQAKWTQYENFKVKITIDIKMAILWQCKNHHNRTKYSIVSLQECFRILQFKSGHPVYMHLQIQGGSVKGSGWCF